MAGLGWKAWTTETLSAPEMQGYLQDQTVMRFASASQRASVLSNPSDGMMTYTEDSDRLWVWEAGSYWRPVDGRWPTVTTGVTFPSGDALRAGDRLWMTAYGCDLVHIGGGSWRQLHPVIRADDISVYKAEAAVAGVTTWHDGFTYFNSSQNRQYMATGGTTFLEVAGTPLSRKTDGITAAAGWTFVANNAWIRSMGGGLAQLSITMTRTGAALPVTAIGDVDNTLMCTLPNEYRAADAVHLMSAASGRMAAGYLPTAGRDLTLAATTPGAPIATGDVIGLGGTYRLGDYVM